MKHIRLFEEEKDLLAEYRDLLELGLIDLKDYYRDLSAAGYRLGDYMTSYGPVVEVVEEINGAHGSESFWIKMRISDIVKEYRGEDDAQVIVLVGKIYNVADFAFEIDLSNGDRLEFEVFNNGTRRRFDRLAINGRELDRAELKALGKRLKEEERWAMPKGLSSRNDWLVAITTALRFVLKLPRGRG